jgi:hypothetical protein
MRGGSPRADGTFWQRRCEAVPLDRAQLRFRVNGIEPPDKLYDLDRRLINLVRQTLKLGRRSRALATLALKVR